MAPSIPEVPQELVDAGATGHLVILVGAGASFGSGLPSWKDLIGRLYSRALTESPPPDKKTDLDDAKSWFEKEGELLEKASFLRQVMGDAWTAKAIAAELDVHSAKPTSTHHELAKLASAAFITTNYDQLLEAALKVQTGVFPKTVLLSDTEGIRDFAAGQVLKIHGDISYPETIVLAVEDYFRVSYRVSSAWKHKLGQLLQRPYQVLLVGYGYGDVDLHDVANELKAAYGDTLSGPFWLEVKTVPSGARARAFGLRPVWLSSFGQLVPWLDALAKAIADKRSQAPAVLKATVYFGKVQEKFREAQEHAGGLFQQQKFELAKAEYERLLEEASALLERDPESPELRRLVSSCRLNIGSCLACLQEDADARELLVQVANNEVGNLSSEAQTVLAAALVQIGERELGRKVLPDESVEPRAREVSQLLEILDGRGPEDEATLRKSRLLRLHHMLKLVENGRLTVAGQEALRLLEDEPKDMLGTLMCLMALNDVLRKSVWEEAGVQWVPAWERGAIVHAIEQGLARLDSWQSISRQSLILRESIKVSFCHLTRDLERENAARRNLVEWGHEPREEKLDDVRADEQARALASEGRLEEAFKTLSKSDHSWVYDFKRTSLLVVANRAEEGLSEAVELARRWPGRAPIEYMVSYLLFRASRKQEALAHARLAFDALPGRGYRVLLAKCLLDSELYEEARTILDHFVDAQEHEVVRLQALAAERGDRRRALELWAQYQKLIEGDESIGARIDLRVAGLLFEVGDKEGAAERAWAAFSRDGAGLELDLLVRCAQFLRLGHGLRAADQERIKAIISTIETRFPGDRQAETYRFELLAALDFPEDAKPPDTRALVATGGLQAVTIDEVREAWRQRHAFVSNVHEAYMAGFLPFESFCELTGLSSATWFSRIASVVEGGIAVVAPVSLAKSIPVRKLEGAKLLAGELEVMLLLHLGLLGRLRSALGSGGQLLLFRDVWDRMVTNAATLEQTTQRVHLKRLDDLFERIEQSPKIGVGDGSSGNDDGEWARQCGLPVIDAEESRQWPQRLSPRAVASFLREKGYLDRERGGRLLSALSTESGMEVVGFERLPGRVAITYASLVIFHQLGALDALLFAISEQVTLTPRTYALLRERRRDLRDGVRAAELASAIQKAVGAGILEGWVNVEVERPLEFGLPLLKEMGEVRERLLREPLAKTLSFREELIRQPELLLLTADFCVAAPIGVNRDAVLALDWSPSELVRFVDRLRVDSSRMLLLPSLVGYLAAENDSPKMLEQLASFGFVDALTAEGLIDLARRYSKIDVGVPARILDRVEWMLRRADHVAAPMASLNIGRVYAEALWKALKEALSGGLAALSETDAGSFVGVLLGRAESLDAANGGALVDLVLGYVCLNAVEEWRESFVDDHDHAGVRLSLDTVPGKIWRQLSSWASQARRRRVAYDRALRNALLSVDELVRGDIAKHIRSVALLLSLPDDSRRLQSPVLETLSILSATWLERPKGDQIESQLREWAQWVGMSDRVASLNEESFVYVSRDNGQHLSDVVAPEAILLRADGDAGSSLAVELVRYQGPHDGRASELLMALSREPGNRMLRTKFARMTVVAPWRLVREDPAMIRTWSWHRRFGERFFPSDLKDLCALLSEPFPLELPDRDLRDVLGTRFEEGVWSERRDRYILIERACEVPGLLSTLMLYGRIDAEKETYVADVEKSLTRLQRPDDFPVARIASDMFFLGAAVARRPHVHLSGRDIDLRDEFPKAILHVLRTTMGGKRNQDGNVVDPKLPVDDGRNEVTLAAVEIMMLRICGSVVIELARPLNVPLRDGLWLTYRLFQWLWAQIEVLPMTERILALVELQSVAPPAMSTPGQSGDLLNPFRFESDGFDYRLAVVLHALSEMSVLPNVLPSGEHDEEVEVSTLSSPELEDLLIEIASRKIQDGERRHRARNGDPSCLGWGSSGVVPDLALATLLWINRDAFVRMPVERRVRWILEMPKGPDDREGLDQKIVLLLLLVLTGCADGLSAEEKVAFEDRLRFVEADDDGVYRLMGFVALYGVGRIHLRDEVWDLLVKNAGHQVAPEALSNYLYSLSHVGPAHVDEEFEKFLKVLETVGVDPVPFALALGRVALHEMQAGGTLFRTVLQDVARREPFKNDERMQSLFRSLSL